MKVGIINVGVNASHGNLMSPIFDDKTFEFVPIPSCSPSKCPDGVGNCSSCTKEYSVFPRYRDLISYEKRLSEFIPRYLLGMRTHNDPELCKRPYTYGDIPSKNPRASNLKQLDPGDRLFFLARLVDWRKGNFTYQAGFYLIGFLEIEHIFKEHELAEIVEKRRFDEQFEKIEGNGHMLMARNFPEFWLQDFPRGWKGSRIFLGSKNSKRFKYAVPFNRALADEIMLDAQGRKWTWPENQTVLQRIGSYTRSCRIIKDTSRIGKLLETIQQSNKDVPERQD